MELGKVVGTVVTSVGHEHYKNRRILIIRSLTTQSESSSDDFIALDNSQAGIGDTVLVLREGTGARQVLENPASSIISVIVGIVDSVHLESID